MRWNSAGRGGSCWDDEDTINEEYIYDKPPFEALSLVLSHYEITDESIINHIQTMVIEEDAGSYRGYYGDYDDYRAAWIELETIYKCLNEYYLISGCINKLIE